jgi:hypothetical protein
LAKYTYTENVNKGDGTAYFLHKGERVNKNTVVELSDEEYDQLNKRFVLVKSEEPKPVKEKTLPPKYHSGGIVPKPRGTPNKRLFNKDKGVK